MVRLKVQEAYQGCIVMAETTFRLGDASQEVLKDLRARGHPGIDVVSEPDKEVVVTMVKKGGTKR